MARNPSYSRLYGPEERIYDIVGGKVVFHILGDASLALRTAGENIVPNEGDVLMVKNLNRGL